MPQILGGSTRGTGLVSAPTPKRQMALVGALYGAGIVAASPSLTYRAYGLASRAVAKAAFIGPVLPALGPKAKVAVRWGGTGEFVRLDQHYMLRMYATPATRGLPLPQFGWGLTSVPAGSTRLPYEMRKKGITNVQVVSGPLSKSSQQRGKTRAATKLGRPSSVRGARRRRAGVNTPWCRVHRRRHWCPLTRK